MMAFKEKRRVIGLFVVLATSLLLAGCAGDSLSGARAVMAAKNRGDIVIGAAWPFAKNDGGLWQGIELAVEEINSSGGINGHQIRILKKDDDASVTKGMAIAQEFAENPEVVAVIGHRNSYISLPAASIYEKAGLVMLTPASTAPELTKQGYHYVFRSIPSDAEIARQLAAYAAGRNLNRIAIYYVNDSYGRGLANSFEDSAKESGINIVDRISYYGDQKGLADLRRKWEALSYNAVFVADSAKGGAQFIVDARRAGITMPFMAGNTMDSPDFGKAAGWAGEGTVIGTVFNPFDARPEAQKFMQAFKAKYQQEPTQYTAQGYDAVKLLAAAVKNAGSTEPPKVAEALRGLKDWPTVAGRHTFDQSGDEKGNLVVKKVLRNGKIEILAETAK